LIVNQHSRLSCAAILTTFNSENTIVDAINSVLSQDESPDEIFVIDDNSSDSTPFLLKQLRDEHPTIEIILNNQNKGQSFTRNQGGFKAKSDLLIFFDDDDVSLPSRIHEHLLLHSRGSQLVYVSSTRNYENGYKVENRNKPIELASYDGVDLVKRLILGKINSELKIGWTPASTLSISRTVFTELEGFDTDFRRLEDSDLAIRAALLNAKFAWSDKLLVHRKATFSDDKGGLIELKYEMQLLDKHSSLLSKNEFFDGMNLIKVRSYYFGKNYLRLILMLFSHPRLYLSYPIRVVRFLSRIIHDMKKSR